jgi:hypothetical protein
MPNFDIEAPKALAERGLPCYPDDLKALIAEIERLRKENFSLATHQCKYPIGNEYGNPQCSEVERLRGEVAEQSKYVTNLEKDRRNINAYLAKAVGPNACHNAYEMVDLLVQRVADAKAVGAAEELDRVTGVFSVAEWGQIDSRALLIQLAAQLKKQVKQ